MTIASGRGPCCASRCETLNVTDKKRVRARISRFSILWLYQSRRSVGLGCLGPRKLSSRFLLQQQFGGLDPRMTVKQALHHFTVQEICQREQAHALMMGHPTAHKFVTTEAG